MKCNKHAGDSYQKITKNRRSSSILSFFTTFIYSFHKSPITTFIFTKTATTEEKKLIQVRVKQKKPFNEVINRYKKKKMPKWKEKAKKQFPMVDLAPVRTETRKL